MEPDQTEWKRADVDRILQRELGPPAPRDSLPLLAAALIVLLLAAIGVATLAWMRDDVRATNRMLREAPPCRS